LLFDALKTSFIPENSEKTTTGAEKRITEMGLDITGSYSKLRYCRPYSCLHRVRWLGAVSIGFEGNYADWDKLSNSDGEAWETYAKKLPALLHHADNEGCYIPAYCFQVEGGQVDISKSFYLGDSDALLAELNALAEWLRNHPKFGDAHAKDIFEELYALVKDECEEGRGYLFFH
jgi:hypothetical protein